MNKKGFVFLPLFAIATIIILVVLAFAIVKNSEEREQKYVEAIGYTPLSLIKVYDEGEKVSLYVESAASYASVFAALNLANNGGYSQDSDCARTLEGIVIWSSCSFFDPESSFKHEFELELKSSLGGYESTYPIFEEKQALVNLRRERNLLPGDVGVSLVKKYTALVKSLKIHSLQIKEDHLHVMFEEMKFPIEYGTQESAYKKRLEFDLPKPELKNYQEIYEKLRECVPPNQKSFSECNLKEAKVRDEGRLKVIEYKGVKFAIDPEESLPPMPFKEV